MATRKRPAQGDNTSLKTRRKMQATPVLTGYGQGAKVHAKPGGPGAVQNGTSTPPKVKRSGPARGSTGGRVLVTDLNK